MPFIRTLCVAGLFSVSAAPVLADTYGPELQGFAYPYPLNHFAFQSQGKSLQMGYMDVPATGTPNGRSVVLMHGKNFCGATWDESIKTLSDAGYRVIAPDQIGFGKSSKPEIRYTFTMLVDQTARLLDHLKVGRTAIVANSMGGMLGQYLASETLWAGRRRQFALKHPGQKFRREMADEANFSDIMVPIFSKPFNS